MVRVVISPGPPAYELVVCSCVRNALAYIVPPAVVDDVPAPYGVVELLKLADKPVVLIAESPDAVVLGVVPEVTTEPTIDSPVAGALLSILYVNAESEFHVPVNLSAWYLVIEFSLLVELIGLEV